MTDQILAAFAVLALLSASLWWLRRNGMARFAGRLSIGRPRRSLEALERLSLAPHHSLHLVRRGGRTLLIGVSPTGCSLLESWENEAVRCGEAPIPAAGDRR